MCVCARMCVHGNGLREPEKARYLFVGVVHGYTCVCVYVCVCVCVRVCVCVVWCVCAGGRHNPHFRPGQVRPFCADRVVQGGACVCVSMEMIYKFSKPC